MPTIKRALHNGLLCLVVTIQIVFYPVATFAQTNPDTDPQAAVDPADTSQQEQAESSTSTPEPDPETVPDDNSTNTAANNAVAPTTQPPAGPQEPTGPQTPTGPQSPTGESSSTYTLNETTGKWENDHYIWDPVTHQTTPKNQQTYSYNPSTGLWDTTEWRFDAPSGRYVANVVSVPNRPGSTASLLHPSGANLGPSASNNINGNSSNSTYFDGFYDVRISNYLESAARSGDAGVIQNTLGGSALSGDAMVIANILNLLQSSWDPSFGDLATFIANINGDVQGDLYLDPTQVSANNQTNADLHVTASGSSRIDNDIKLDATSGDATVAANTEAGSAKSGAASAFANIINLINSIIFSGKSFVGVININGNYDGDILIPNWLASLLASNAPNSNNNASSTTNTNLDVELSDTQTINNDVTTTASSGQATVSDNTKAGSASSGQANTNILLLNLTGRQVVASNALLVFVNVLGSWVGLIMDAPAGTTAAALGGGVSQNNSLNANADVDITTEGEINNNVSVNAASGDAAVRENTRAGDATSGNANAGANVLNIINSQFAVSDWFGVLFINVLGKWNGSFGINTAAGNAAVASASTAGSSASGSSNNSPPPVFSFLPGAGNNNNSQFAAVYEQAQEAVNQQQQTTATAGTTGNNPPTSSNNASSGAPVPTSSSRFNLWIPAAGIMAGVLWMGGERVVAMLIQRRKLV